MKIHTSDKFIAYLTLFSGLSISAVAVYYSVAGLVSIFAAAVVPIIVMGTVLELSKLVATVWLKLNWKRAPVAIRTYLFVAITILMFITSMGIFGYLSKAHLDQAVPTGDVAAKVAIIDEKIKTERDNIEAARRALSQMDASVDQTLGRSTSEQGADKAVAIRKSQAKERASLQKDIAASQTAIAKLNEERAPIASELRKVEAEVGPIKYIAALVYGDNPDANLLESAVRWVIIIIVLVFDPLAVILLLASQYSFMWFRQQEDDDTVNDVTTDIVIEEPISTPEDDVFTEDDYDELNAMNEVEVEEDHGNCPKCNTKLNYAPGIGSYCPNPNCDVVDGVNLVYENEPEVESSKKSDPPVDPTWAFFPEETLEPVIELTQEDRQKEAKRIWKEANPNETIHRYTRMKKLGLIDKLPWDEIESQLDNERPGDYVINTEESKKKDNNLDGTGRAESNQEDSGVIGDYVQNEEQNVNSIWQKLKRKNTDV